jgi:hypothetical protein
VGTAFQKYAQHDTKDTKRNYHLAACGLATAATPTVRKIPKINNFRSIQPFLKFLLDKIFSNILKILLYRMTNSRITFADIRQNSDHRPAGVLNSSSNSCVFASLPLCRYVPLAVLINVYAAPSGIAAGAALLIFESVEFLTRNSMEGQRRHVDQC